jgi:hypothetical protein
VIWINFATKSLLVNVIEITASAAAMSEPELDFLLDRILTATTPNELFLEGRARDPASAVRPRPALG